MTGTVSYLPVSDISSRRICQFEVGDHWSRSSVLADCYETTTLNLSTSSALTLGQ